MKELAVFDTPVKIDDEQLISITDIWKAAKAAGKKVGNLRPVDFLRSSITQSFINELVKGGEFTPFRVVKGRNGGTFVTRFLAYEYAGYIDPSFKVGVYTVLDKYFSGEMVTIASYMADANMADHILKEEASIVSDCARTMNYWGLGGRKKQLVSKQQEAYARLQLNVPGIE
ncbi:KilA-N domain-containing protein [Rosenbergiella australiborealis]|uniref:KilA-N domain-containing protein n=1 Tax=Rosenbergiella australiborealis TaxID=1544696 RepID=UPI001F4DFC93|nr:KilA-N domain-containing protein [Rosenbergiella australiborealis]